jgi:hypothetical protein
MVELDMENPYSARVKDLERLTEYFFLGSLPEELAVEVPSVLQPTVESFKTNLRALFWATEVPYLLSFYAAYKRAFDRHLVAERIRALDPADVVKKLSDPSYEKSKSYLKKLEDGNARALVAAWEKFSSEHLTPEGKSKMEERAINDLVSLLGYDLVCLASKELLRQSIVLTWVAFEALATDLFILALNCVPHLTIQLLRDEQSKKRFQSRDLAKIVEQHGFDLSNKMGEVLKSLGNLDDLETMKAVFQVICPSSEALRVALAQPELWKLYQRRNLLVHRAGVVDKSFLEKTGEQFEVGAKLTFVSEDVSRFFNLVRGVGKEMITAVAEAVK